MNAQVYREASDWLIEFRTDEANGAARQRFAAWLEKSPEHIRAYLELISVWEDSAQLDGARKIDLNALIALSRADADIVDLPFERAAVKPTRAKSRAFALAASVALVACGCAAFGYWFAYERGSYVTNVGQQRSLTLIDGTTVELNADTRIRERYTARQRTVELIGGQALFRVAKDSTRPFVVISGTAAVRAVGTQFDVYRKDNGTTVTVIEGRVAVKGDASQAPASSGEALTEILLKPGEQLRIAPRIALRPVTANVAAATAWTQQKLLFESATLADAAREFNRFNTRKLIVTGEGLEDFRINGTFPALDPNSLPRFLAFLREQPGIAVRDSGGEILVSKNR